MGPLVGLADGERRSPVVKRMWVQVSSPSKARLCLITYVKEFQIHLSFDQGPPAGLSSPARGHWFTLRGSCEEGHPGASVSPESRAYAAHTVSRVAWPTRSLEHTKTINHAQQEESRWNEVGQVWSGQLLSQPRHERKVATCMVTTCSSPYTLPGATHQWEKTSLTFSQIHT